MNTQSNITADCIGTADSGYFNDMLLPIFMEILSNFAPTTKMKNYFETVAIMSLTLSNFYL